MFHGTLKSMNHIDNKKLFKEIINMGKSYSDDMPLRFAYFCLKTLYDDLSDDDLDDMLDNLHTNDNGIDAYYVDEGEGSLNFFQFKSGDMDSHKEFKLKAAKKEDLAYLYDIQNKLTNSEHIDNHKNDRIKEIAADFKIKKADNYSVHFHFYHLGHLPDYALLTSYENFKYYGIEEIKNQYQEYLSKIDQTEPESIDIHLTSSYIEESISNSKKTFVTLITGTELFKLRDQHKFKLFDKNIRFSLGKNKINNKIIKTCKERPNDFYFYNNGITITSKGFKYRETNGTLKINFPQVINGAQTVSAIHTAYSGMLKLSPTADKEEAKKQTQEHFNKVKVLVRVIYSDGNDDKFENEVIINNNAKNEMQSRDFYSNNKEQTKLQRYFSELGFFYEIKRGEREYIQKNPHNLLNKRSKDFPYFDEKIDIVKMASVWQAYHKQSPALNQIGKTFIFGSDKEYDAVFPKEEDIEEERVKEMVLAWMIFSILEKETKTFKSQKAINSLISKKDFHKDPKIYEKAKKVLSNSILFDDMTKNKFNRFDQLSEEERQAKLGRIKALQPYASAKYLSLAVFKKIIEHPELNYKNHLIQTSLYKDKRYIKEKMVSPWLKIIFNEIILPDYLKFGEERAAISSYWTEINTYERLKTRFVGLPYKLQKDFIQIFPFGRC